MCAADVLNFKKNGRRLLCDHRCVVDSARDSIDGNSVWWWWWWLIDGGLRARAGWVGLWETVVSACSLTDLWWTSTFNVACFLLLPRSSDSFLDVHLKDFYFGALDMVEPTRT